MFLDGVKISDLSTAKNILTDDYLLISEPFSKEIGNTNDYYSKNIQFGTILSDQVKAFNDLCIFNSMAFEDENAYSKLKHTHTQYTKVSVETFYTSTDDTIKLGTISVNGKRFDIFSPQITITEQRKPQIGELKFLHINNPPYIDEYSDDFDGWVYADGKAYNINDFPQVSVFLSYDVDLFCVPNLNNFIKMNSTPYLENNMDEQNSDVLIQHSHNITITPSETKNGTLTLKNHKAYSTERDTIGSTYYYQSTKQINTTINLNDINIKNSDYIQENIETEHSQTYPTYNNTLVMIYIGERIS